MSEKNTTEHSTTTTDHNEIERWVEHRNGKPAHVTSEEEQDEYDPEGVDPGILRISFQEDEDDALEELSWARFFGKFEAESLAFVYQEETESGDQSRFCKFVSRESDEEPESDTLDPSERDPTDDDSPLTDATEAPADSRTPGSVERETTIEEPREEPAESRRSQERARTEQPRDSSDFSKRDPTGETSQTGTLGDPEEEIDGESSERHTDSSSPEPPERASPSEESPERSTESRRSRDTASADELRDTSGPSEHELSTEEAQDEPIGESIERTAEEQHENIADSRSPESPEGDTTDDRRQERTTKSEYQRDMGGADELRDDRDEPPLTSDSVATVEASKGQPVVNDAGERIGIVSEVSNRQVFIKTDPEVATQSKTELGLEADDPDTNVYAVGIEQIETIDGTVRIYRPERSGL